MTRHAYMNTVTDLVIDKIEKGGYTVYLVLCAGAGRT